MTGGPVKESAVRKAAERSGPLVERGRVLRLAGGPQ